MCCHPLKKEKGRRKDSQKQTAIYSLYLTSPAFHFSQCSVSNKALHTQSSAWKEGIWTWDWWNRRCGWSGLWCTVSLCRHSFCMMYSMAWLHCQISRTIMRMTAEIVGKSRRRRSWQRDENVEERKMKRWNWSDLVSSHNLLQRAQESYRCHTTVFTTFVMYAWLWTSIH